MVMPRFGCPSSSNFPLLLYKRESGGRSWQLADRQIETKKMRQAGLRRFFGGGRRYAAAPDSAGRRLGLSREKIFKDSWYQ
jgi:hypothetical protein